MAVIIGVDPHKASHTAVAVTPSNRFRVLWDTRQRTHVRLLNPEADQRLVTRELLQVLSLRTPD